MRQMCSFFFFLREEHSYFEQFFTALVTMLVLSHHPSYIHVHFVIDLGWQVAIVHRVSAVA